MAARRERDDGGAERLARSLGWFSLGLGLTQLTAPRGVARMIGLRGDDEDRKAMLAIGMRELASGIGILMRDHPTPAVWSRVGGDVMDLALLGRALNSSRTNRNRVAAATVAVAGVTVLDVLAGQRLPRDLDERRDEVARLLEQAAGPVLHNPTRGNFLLPNAQRYGRFLSEWGAIYERFGVPAEVGLAQVILESGLNGTRRSEANAVGFCQWLQGNWKRLNRLSPAEIEGLLSERTAALVTSHVLFTSGAVQDVARLSSAARRAGAVSIVDAYQGTGQLPTDVRSIGCDVLLTGGLKWLLGGTGICYAYVSRGAQARLTPTIAGWFGDADQFAFDGTRFRPRDDARRYELGTPPLPSVFAGSAGLERVHGRGDLGLARAHSCRDLQRL